MKPKSSSFHTDLPGEGAGALTTTTLDSAQSATTVASCLFLPRQPHLEPYNKKGADSTLYGKRFKWIQMGRVGIPIVEKVGILSPGSCKKITGKFWNFTGKNQ